MIAEKCLPSLRRRSPLPGHIFGNRRLPNIDAELEEFAVDPWGAPEWVGNADFANQLADVLRRPRPAAMRSRSPSPIQTETCAVPMNNGFGLTIAKALSTLGAKPYSPVNTRRSMLARVGRFGDLRSRILSWWRSVRISSSSEACDRNNPISLSLQSSIIKQKLHPIRCCPPVVLGLRQGQGSD